MKNLSRLFNGRTSSSRANHCRYLYTKSIERDSRYKSVTSDDIQWFRDKLGESSIVCDEMELDPYNTDWLHNWRGQSKLALKPKSVEHVSEILRYCNERSLAVVPQGGNTGLVGGSIPVFDEIILCMSRMNNVVDLDATSGVVTVESGMILQQLNSYLEDRGFIMPLDLGAKGSCQIGGNASTNAGGIRFMRYGSLHGSILGIEAVLANGDVLDCLSTMRKDNTGYDLKQLMIGSEGTLGVITKLSIAVPRKPSSVNVTLLNVKSFPAVLACMQSARSHLSEIVSAIEFFDRKSLQLVLKHIPGASNPIPDTSDDFYMVIETSGSNHDHDTEKLDGFLQSVMEDGTVTNGTIASDEAQAANIWKLRETIAEALVKEGAVYKYDVSVPTDCMYALVEEMR